MSRNRKISKKDIAKQNQKLIREMKAEIRRLRKENEYMKYICAQYEPAEEEKQTPEQKALAECAKNADVYRSKNYFVYLFARLRRSRLFRLFDKTRFAMKKFKFAKKLWFFGVTLFTVLGISAQILVVLGALAVFLPAALIFSALIGIYTYFKHRNWKKIFRKLMTETDTKEKIYLVFVPKNGAGDYFIRSLPSLAEKGKVFMIFRRFRDCNASRIAQTKNNIYKIHVSFYFSFVRRLPSERIVKIYL